MLVSLMSLADVMKRIQTQLRNRLNRRQAQQEAALLKPQPKSGKGKDDE
jgi:hypothetical protein